MLKKEDLEKFRSRLMEDKDKIEKEVKKLQSPTDFGDEIDHGEEESDEDEELENKSSVADNYKDRLIEIESALNRIKNGKYGICENCGKNIELKVLNAVPESKLCSSCKKK